jgi:hypothetical protein
MAVHICEELKPIKMLTNQGVIYPVQLPLQILEPRLLSLRQLSRVLPYDQRTVLLCD